MESGAELPRPPVRDRSGHGRTTNGTPNRTRGAATTPTTSVTGVAIAAGAPGAASGPTLPSSSTAGIRSSRLSPIPRAASASLWATENAARRLAEEAVALPMSPEVVRPDAIAARLSPDAVHQGLLAEADPLPSPPIEDLAGAGTVLVLDQITDPHNVGAILRSAAAFAVNAIVTTARHSPEATGVLAKSASGALELVPIVAVQNLARALAALKERGFLTVGLDSAAARRPRRDCAVRAARAGARRRGQRLAPAEPAQTCDRCAARSARRDQEPQRVECRGGGALRCEPRPRATGAELKNEGPRGAGLQLTRTLSQLTRFDQ